jgi:GNAT superfamily N-acetyltransferase
MLPITITRLAPADHEEWLRLWQEWQHYKSGKLSFQVNARTWQLICNERSGLFGFIARSEDAKAVAIAHASVTPFAWAAGPIVYLQDLFVTAPMRGHGVGAALLKAVYAYADELGAVQVFWLVEDGDTELQRFYERYAIRSPYIRFLRNRWPWFAADHH